MIRLFKEKAKRPLLVTTYLDTHPDLYNQIFRSLSNFLQELQP